MALALLACALLTMAFLFDLRRSDRVPVPYAEIAVIAIISISYLVVSFRGRLDSQTALTFIYVACSVPVSYVASLAIVFVWALLTKEPSSDVIFGAGTGVFAMMLINIAVFVVVSLLGYVIQRISAR
jgi:hypothetical protein